MKENKLTGMGFTITCDRPVDPKKHYISPGGYELNGKKFDFCDLIGNRVDGSPNKVHFEVENFDETYYEENQHKWITKTDLTRGTFTDFYIYTGENDIERINVLSVEGIWFLYDGKYIEPSDNSRITKSANKCIREQFTEVRP